MKEHELHIERAQSSTNFAKIHFDGRFRTDVELARTLEQLQR